jgi:DNA repair ATPase RecN
MAAAGLVSFGGALVIGWLTGSGRSIEPNQATVTGQESKLKPAQASIGIPSITRTGETSTKTATMERQLQDFIIEVREKMREYNSKLQSLQTREQRLQMTQDVLKKDINDLNNLRTEVSSMIARLKEERDKLLKTRLEISQAEKGNLTTVAAAYDKMDASSASKILTSMCTGGVTQKQDGQVRLWATGFDDAVKILHYMSERTKAKLLAELVNTEPKLAASLCERLKQINEVR